MTRRSTLTVTILSACTFVLTTSPVQSQDRPSLVQPGAKAVKLAGGFQFTEGPAADRIGNVFFSDIPNERIHKWSIDGTLSTFRESSGRANGLFFDRCGHLIACEGGSRRLTSSDPAGNVTVLWATYGGNKFNSPNDLWIDACGGIYFTDPRYGSEEGLEQGGFYVYYLFPSRCCLERVVDDLVKPNGVIGTADGRKLYIADPGDQKTYVYDVHGQGMLSEKRLFATQGSDGMTLDERGNVYLTSREGIKVYDEAGKLIETIVIPESPANVTFGGQDLKTLFVTARTSLYSVQMAVRGQ